MTRDTVALVESPAQLLHVLEWAHAEHAAHRTVAVVLAPVEATSVAQLRRLAVFADEEDIQVEWYAPRGSLLARLSTVRQVAGRVSRARRLVIGDPFSGMIQALLLSAHPREAIVVDDGTATLEFVSQLGSGEPLRRWDALPSPLEVARGPLGQHARRFFAAERVRVFTVMPVVGLPPSRIHNHGYEWTRARFGTPKVVAGVDVVGSSLAESGVVDQRAYLEAIEGLAARSGWRGRYFAHRKESVEKLALITDLGLRVMRPEVPLEVELCRGPVSAKLASFPSSVGYTLPLVLAGAGVKVELQPVPTGMLTPKVGPAARRFLDRISADLRGGELGVVSPFSASA